MPLHVGCECGKLDTVDPRQAGTRIQCTACGRSLLVPGAAGDAALYDQRGEVYRYKGETAKALADYGLAIQLDPKSPHAYVHRALVRAAQGEREQAVADFSAALRLSPDNKWALAGRGQVYRLL